MFEKSRYSKLAKITEHINSKLDLRQSLEQVVIAISEEIVQCGAVGIYLPQPNGTYQGYVSKPNILNGLTIDKLIIDPRTDILAQNVIETRKSIYIPDTALDTRPDPKVVGFFKIKSLLVLPISHEEEFFGLVFLFDYGIAMNLTIEEIQTVEAYVNMAAVAIRNTKLLERKTSLLYEKQLMLDAVRDISLCLTMQEVLDTCFRYVGTILGNSNIAVHLMNEQGKTFQPAKLSEQSDWTEEDWKKVHKETNVDFQKDLLFQEVILTKKAVFIPDVSVDPRPNQQACQNFGIRGVLMMPLVATGKVLGTIAVVSLEEIIIYSEGDLELAQSTIDATATALSNLMTLEKLEKLVKIRTIELSEKNNKLVEVVATIKRLSHHNELILNSAGEGIYGLNLLGEISFCNPVAASMLGYEVDELLGQIQEQVLSHLKSDQTRYIFQESPIYAALKEGSIQTVTDEFFCRKDGSMFHVEYISTPIKESDEIVGVVVTFKDITVRKQMEEKIQYQAYYDSVTNLPNRVFFKERLSKAFLYSLSNETMFAVLFLDLDRFKLINDTMGHSFGDQVLKLIAERLKECVQANDTIARQGGDEFLILVDNIQDTSQITEMAERIIKVLSKPFYMDCHELFFTTSIGISLYPTDAKDLETIIRNADTAMYQAKDKGGNCFHYYAPIMNKQNSERAELLNSLHNALDRNEFKLHYQPKVDMRTGTIIGMEALIRWLHPQRGLIPPATFIPLAEESGLILPIGEWVMRTACKQTKAWQNSGSRDITIAVNLSTRQFNEPNIGSIISSALQESELDPKYLELELTENVIIQNTAMVIQKMHDLKSLGIQISLDDFGTGYSSLRYLIDFPIDTLKIDQSFVRNCSRDSKAAAITEMVIGLTQSLNIAVIAEGVETQEELTYLLSRKCYIMQGFYFSQPISDENMFSLLQHPIVFK